MIVKKFGVDFNSTGALTLDTAAVSSSFPTSGTHTRTHDRTGWTITGRISGDYYVWVNSFEAHHPEYGKVWGDFELEVYAETEEGFADFYKNHTPKAWDKWDN